MNTKRRNAYEATKYIVDEMTFGRLIRALRECDDITQVALAKKIGVSSQFLSDVERDRKDVGIAFAKKVSRALGYPVEIFLEVLLRDQLRKQNINLKVTLQKAS